MNKSYHIALEAILLAMVCGLMLLCVAWGKAYDELQADQHKAATVALKRTDDDVWVLVNQRHVYRFPGVCTQHMKVNL